MRPDDRRSAFPSTRWSRILVPDGARDLDALAHAYWRPIQAYLKARLRCSETDADDLAQSAFAWMLDTGLLDKADPTRGRFRGFLKRALANFAIEQVRHGDARKRGGGVGHASLDDLDPVDPTTRTPDQILDDAWRRTLLERAHHDLQRDLEGSGRATYWALFCAFYLAADEPPTHAALAERHAISRTDVSNWLDHAKRRYRAILHGLVAETVSTDADLRAELAWLFGSVGGSS